MKVYLAGPMSFRKDIDWNFPAFHEAAARLRRAVFEVINPAEHFDGDTSLDYDTYIRHDIRQLTYCDAIITLPGWQDSKGASIEVGVANLLGIRHIEYESLLDVL